MTLSERQRKAIIGFVILCAAGAILFLPTIYMVGLWLAPPRPVPATADLPKVFEDAVWARIDGGKATELRPVNPFNLAGLAGCMVLGDLGDPPEQAEKKQDCREELAGLEFSSYFSRLYMREHNSGPGNIRWVFASMATGAWVSRHWTKKELVQSLATLADFGLGWRGAENASRGYFGKPLSDVTLPQAALLAGYIGSVGRGDLGTANTWWDPWCAPVYNVTKLRRPVLQKMRRNGVIDDAAFESADRSDLGLTPEPPPGHTPCPE
jgi:hypothetical protein